MHLGHKTSMHYFSYSGGTGTDSIKSTSRHIMSNMCFHPVGSVGHVVHFGVSGAQNIDVLFFILEWPDAVSIKSTPGHITLNLCFCILWDLRVM
jgi:hypothetical protein